MSKKAKKVKRDRRAEAKAFDVAVGARIRTRRKAKPMKQEVLATSIGISGAQMSRYENGETTCEPYALDQIAQALGCKVSDFTDGIEVIT